MSFNRETKWAKNLVNLNQTCEERQAKYRLARSLEANPSYAQKIRDWREVKIRRALGK